MASTFTQGIPIRAAISWGELAVVSNEHSDQLKTDAVVGRALVGAYVAEGIQEWSGGIVTNEAVRRYEFLARPDTVTLTQGVMPGIEVLQGLGWLKSYAVPTKDGASLEQALAWPTLLNEEVSAGAVRDAFTQHGKTVNPAVEVKIANTIAFVEECGRLRH